TVLETLTPVFEQFLVVEIWTAPAAEASPDGGRVNRFTILRSVADGRQIARQFARSLGGMGSGETRVDVLAAERIAPPGMAPLLSEEDCDDCILLGLECPAPYKGASTEEFYAVVHRRFRRELAFALQE